MFDRFLRDTTFAARSLLRSRGVTSVAIASLAVGIAANATIFSLVQAVEFPSLIYPEASRIVFLESRNHQRGLIGMPVSAPDALDIVAATHTLDLPSLTADQTSILRQGASAKRVTRRRVMPSFFEVMRVPPSLGRMLAANDGQDAIVLSDGLWRNELGTDPAIVGRPIRLDGGTVTVVGVMPPRFDADADFWVPLSPSLAGFARDDRQFTLFARLAPQATLGEASRELSDISSRLAADQPATNKDWVTFPIALTRMHGRDSRGAFILLQGAVAFVLLIACANIANILLARASTRRNEMALRVALGASRSHLVRGLLTESVMISLAGGVAGVMLSMWGIRLAKAVGGFPEIIDPSLNRVVLGFTAALSMLTGMLCGIVPALRASNVAPEPLLRAGSGRGTAGQTRGRLRSGLVAAQVAGALVLATCGGLMVKSFANRERVNLGFDSRNALRADVSLSGDRYRKPEALTAAVDGIFERLRREPDVVSAGASTWALPTSAGAQRDLTLPSERDEALDRSIRRGVEAVTPGYFDALGAPVTLGRAFIESDRAGTEPIALVNEELVRHLWPNRNPVGELLRLGAAEEHAPVVTVVGVVSTIRRSRMHDVPVARVYVPYAQYPNASLAIIVRARTDVRAAGRALQDAVQSTDSSLLVEGLRSVDADLAQFVAPIRLITSLLGGFGVVGLLLAGLGVFGTMSYSVSQREREMAVRAALGAARGDILRLVFGSALRITAAGVLAGVIVATAATRALSSFLFGVSPNDPATFVTVIGFLTIVALASCYRPARAAATADPMTILRQ